MSVRARTVYGAGPAVVRAVSLAGGCSTGARPPGFRGSPGFPLGLSAAPRNAGKPGRPLFGPLGPLGPPGSRPLSVSRPSAVPRSGCGPDPRPGTRGERAAVRASGADTPSAPLAPPCPVVPVRCLPSPRPPLTHRGGRAAPGRTGAPPPGGVRKEVGHPDGVLPGERRTSHPHEFEHMSPFANPARRPRPLPPDGIPDPHAPPDGPGPPPGRSAERSRALARGRPGERDPPGRTVARGLGTTPPRRSPDGSGNGARAPHGEMSTIRTGGRILTGLRLVAPWSAATEAVRAPSRPTPRGHRPGTAGAGWGRMGKRAVRIPRSPSMTGNSRTGRSP